VGGYTGIRLSVCPSVCSHNGFRALECYPYHRESPYHRYRLPMGGRCSLLILKSKGQMSSTLDIKVEIRFSSSRLLLLLPTVTISHILTTNERKMFPIDQRSSTLDIKVEIWFLSSRLLSLQPRVTILHI
jgi:hypothetical protein